MRTTYHDECDRFLQEVVAAIAKYQERGVREADLLECLRSHVQERQRAERPREERQERPREEKKPA